MAAAGLTFAGSARTLIAALSAQLQATAANYLVGQLVFGDMSLAESARSIDVFTSAVMPALLEARRNARQSAISAG
jgi:hypothetical protein